MSFIKSSEGRGGTNMFLEDVRGAWREVPGGFVTNI